MSSRIDFLRLWIGKFREAQNKLAHSALQSALTPDAYNERRGRYRQLSELLQVYTAEIRRIQGGDKDGDAPVDDGDGLSADDDAEFDDAPPLPSRAKSTAPRRRPRQWTGG